MRGERHWSYCLQDETYYFNIHRIDLERIVNHVVIHVRIVVFILKKEMLISQFPMLFLVLSTSQVYLCCKSVFCTLNELQRFCHLSS